MKSKALQSKGVLKDVMTNKLGRLIVKNLLFTERGGSTYLWITYTYETAVLDGMVLQDKSKIVRAVQEHAREFWQADDEAVEAIIPTKIDVTKDIVGSFLARDKNAAQEKLLLLIQ
jgi:hypothetical protein